MLKRKVEQSIIQIKLIEFGKLVSCFLDLYLTVVSNPW